MPSLSRSPTTSSSISQDCASNTTLLTNTSPFNSQQALISEKKSIKTTAIKNNHYYADNLRHENDFKNGEIYNPLIKDNNNYKQLEPLLSSSTSSSKERIVIEDNKILMDSQFQLEQKDDNESSKKNNSNQARTRKGRSKLANIEIAKYPSQVSCYFIYSRENNHHPPRQRTCFILHYLESDY